MKPHRTLLKRLLQSLVDEWGQEQVAAALKSIAPSADRPASEHPGASKAGSPRKAATLSAAAQVQRLRLDGVRNDALSQLASSYDRKQFLPSVADVREFLIMRGERPVGMKSRADAFRILLRSLAEWPVERLQLLATSAQHTGPAQLGPLSDAIASVGEQLPRRKPDEPKDDPEVTGGGGD